MAKKYRYAPSPTGKIHLGQIKASFFPYSLAKNSGGKFVLRIEDTDNKRNKPEAVELLLDDLNWLGIEYDEGPVNAFDKNEYFQSQRQEFYKTYIDQLLSEGKAYKAYDTQEEREEQIKKQRSSGQMPVYFGEKLSDEEEKRLEAEGRVPVIRLKVPRGEIIEFEDKIFGKVSVSTNTIGDLVIQKSDGTPMYNFCVVIDDHLMGITDVVRGFGHLSNTAKQVLIYKILGWEAPMFAHFSDVLAENIPGKLSKRSGAKPIQQYRAEGYLKESILNYIVVISCSFKFEDKEQEIMSEEEYSKAVSYDKILKTNAKFNTQKLDWFNGQHIRRLSNEDFIEKVISWLKTDAKKLKEYDETFDETLIETFLNNEEILKKTLPLIKERIMKFNDIFSYLKFFFIAPNSNDIDLTATKHEVTEIDQVVTKIYNIVSSLKTPWTHEEWEQSIRVLADEIHWKHGDLFMALRLKIVGSPYSPPLFESMEILGRDECLRRIG